MSDKPKEWREFFVYEGPTRFKDKNGIKTLGLEVYNDKLSIVACTEFHVIERAALTQAEAEIARLKRQLADYEHECETIKEMKAKVKEAEREIAKWKTTALNGPGGKLISDNLEMIDDLERLTKENAELKEDFDLVANGKLSKGLRKTLVKCKALTKQNEEQAKEIEWLGITLETARKANLSQCEIIAVLENSLIKIQNIYDWDKVTDKEIADNVEDVTDFALAKLNEWRGK